MSTTTELLDAPPPELRFKRRINFFTATVDLWKSRELVFGLTERDVRARYKQAYLGFAWSLITPLAMMVVFTFVFDRVAKVDTQGVPYTLFSYTGLMAWTFFSKSLSVGGMNLIKNKALLNKVHCPREVFPLAGMGTAVVDTAVAMVLLVVLFVTNGFVPQATTLWVPVLFIVQLAFTMGVVLLFSAVVVYLRDLSNTLTIILQLGVFATPIGYSINEIPASLQTLYAAVNPLGPIVDGYRRTVLLGLPPDWGLLGVSSVTAFLLLGVGYVVFKKLETGFADVA